MRPIPLGVPTISLLRDAAVSVAGSMRPAQPILLRFPQEEMQCGNSSSPDKDALQAGAPLRASGFPPVQTGYLSARMKPPSRLTRAGHGDVVVVTHNREAPCERQGI